jgi:tight adherence protein C
MLVLTVLIFFSITLGIAGLYFWLAPTRTKQRLQSMSQPTERPAWAETMASVVGPFAKLSAPDGNWETSPLRIRFINAGIRDGDARLIYFGLKTLLPLLLSGIAFFGLRSNVETDDMTLFLYLALAALFGCYLPNIVLFGLAKTRKREIFENFPDAADLMLVCVEAGLGLDAALTKVADEMKIKSVALAEEIHLSNLEMRAGGTREAALRNLALRSGVEEVSTFATMLTQADKFGTSIGDSLRVFSDDLRHKRQTRAEEQAAKIPTKLLFPLVVFIFPAIIMVIMGPAVIQLLRTVLPMMTGTAS